jgi:cholesterol oxidase
MAPIEVGGVVTVDPAWWTKSTRRKPLRRAGDRPGRLEPLANRAAAIGAFDFAVIGSGFGGSVSALRLAEKGYRASFSSRAGASPRRLPAATGGCGPLWLHPSPARIHAPHFPARRRWYCMAAVGGGSLVYANADGAGPELFEDPVAPLADWRTILRRITPRRADAGRHRDSRTAPADEILRDVAAAFGWRRPSAHRSRCLLRPGRDRTAGSLLWAKGGPCRCTFCGGCMVGCRHNAKNTLTKNYLYLAERRGAHPARVE